MLVVIKTTNTRHFLYLALNYFRYLLFVQFYYLIFRNELLERRHSVQLPTLYSFSIQNTSFGQNWSCCFDYFYNQLNSLHMSLSTNQRRSNFACLNRLSWLTNSTEKEQLWARHHWVGVGFTMTEQVGKFTFRAVFGGKTFHHHLLQSRLVSPQLLLFPNDQISRLKHSGQDQAECHEVADGNLERWLTDCYW